jgi:hypothetical protein
VYDGSTVVAGGCLGESDMGQKTHSQRREEKGRGGEGNKRTKAMGKAKEEKRESTREAPKIIYEKALTRVLVCIGKRGFIHFYLRPYSVFYCL